MTLQLRFSPSSLSLSLRANGRPEDTCSTDKDGLGIWSKLELLNSYKSAAAGLRSDRMSFVCIFYMSRSLNQ